MTFLRPLLLLAAASAQLLRVENELALLDAPSFTAHADVARDLRACAAGACPARIGAADANVSAAPAVVDEGGVVTISYAVRAPRAADFIALYPNVSTLSAATLPLKWSYVDDANYLATGVGARRFQLANFRLPGGFVFGLLTGATKDRYGSLSIVNATLVALTTPATRLSGDVLAPQRPRLTPGASDGSTLRVTWTSGRDASSAPALQWGTAAGSYPFAGRRVNTSHLTNASLCGPPASGTGFSDLGFTHSAEVVLAEAGATRPTRIYYVISDSVATSAETNAVVPPVAAPLFPSTLIAFDDLGRGSLDDAKTYAEYGTPSVNTSRYIAQLLDANADAFPVVWHVGDVSYATGLLAIWDWWSFMISSWAGRVVYAVGVGNHESGHRWNANAIGPDASNHFSLFDNNDAGGECGVVTNHVVPLPADATPDAPWSLYLTGPFALVTLSSEHDFTTGSVQWRWLAATLAAVNRTTTPWLLVGLHRPMYVDSNYIMDTPAQRGRGPSSADVPVMTALQTHVEPLTMRYKASLMLYGHNHAVQVLTPAFANASVQSSVPAARADGSATRLFSRPRASLHMVIGTGGAGFTPNCATAPGVGLKPPTWDERCFYQWGVAKITAQSSSLLQIDWVDSSTGVVAERIDLVQDLAQPWADAPAAPAAVDNIVAAAVGGTVGGLALVLLAAGAWLRFRAPRVAYAGVSTSNPSYGMVPGEPASRPLVV